MFFVVIAGWMAGCGAYRSQEPISRGQVSNGHLHRGVALPDRGEGYVRARPGEPTKFGLPRLIRVIEHLAADTAATFPDTQPIRVGDLSSPRGGKHWRHRSHRSGRDVDLIFYATDADGRSIRGRGWVAYDRFGVGNDSHESGLDRLVFFDDARNWHVVRTVLLDEEALVRWIFVSRGVKARLLRYAMAHEPNRELIFRASWVLLQPERASPHDDHFHIRLACGPRQRALGCRDRGPNWPWWRDSHEKTSEPQEALTDARILEELFREEEQARERAQQ